MADPRAFRKRLTRLLEASGEVGFISAYPFAQRHSPNTPHLMRALKIAFTWTGLERLGLAKEHLDGMPLAFRQGMAERADILGDVDQWAPNTWQGALGCTHIHVLIAAFCMDGDVNDYWREIRTRLEPEANPVGPDFIGRFSGWRRSAGYRGRWSSTAPPKEERGRRRRIRAGISGCGWKRPDCSRSCRRAFSRSVRRRNLHGVRKIEQEVDRFTEDLATSERLSGGEDLATRLVGRRRDKTSLAVHESGSGRPHRGTWPPHIKISRFNQCAGKEGADQDARYPTRPRRSLCISGPNP